MENIDIMLLYAIQISTLSSLSVLRHRYRGEVTERVCAGPGGSGETLGQSLLECSRVKGNSRQAYWALDVEKLGNKCWENKSCGSAGPTKM